MKDYGQIRQMYIRDGKSIRQIAREMHISRNTVAEYSGLRVHVVRR